MEAKGRNNSATPQDQLIMRPGDTHLPIPGSDKTDPLDNIMINDTYSMNATIYY